MGWVVGWGCPMGGHQGGQNRQNSGPDGAGGKKWWKFKISIFLVKLCCNLMILAKKPNVNRNFGSKMPNYSCGGCWRFWGLDHSTLKAYIFLHRWEKVFLAGCIRKNKKRSFRSSQILSTFLHLWPHSDLAKYSENRFFFWCLTNPTFSSCICKVNRSR